MKKYHIFFIMILALFAQNMIQAQSDPAVLVMDNNNFNNVYRTGLDLKSLLANGNSGEATLEFWIKADGSNKTWILSDLQANGENFSLVLGSNGNLSISNGQNTQTFAFTGAGGVATWHHVSLVFRNAGSLLGVYLNGLKKAEFNNLQPNTTKASELVFEKSNNTKLYLTELRAWNKARHFSEIEGNWLKTFVYKTGSELTFLKNNAGLAAIFGTDNSNSLPLPYLTDIEQLTWQNYLGNITNVSNGKGNGKVSSTTLIYVTKATEHPIVQNNLLQVDATKGKHLNKVVVTWGHLADVDKYTILKDGEVKHVETNLGSTPISGDVTWEDTDVIPGEGHTYTVEATKTGTSFSASGTDDGFIPFNGKLAGQVVSQSGVYVQDVKITAKPNDNVLPGKALSFNGSSANIAINNISAFQDMSQFTLSFWYKAASPNNTSDNGVFKLGNMKVYFEGGNLKATNGSQTLTAAIGTDGQWHHYAVAFGNGGNIKQDGISKKSGSLPMSIGGTTSEFYFNYQAGSTYYLDEVSVWETTFSDSVMQRGYQHLLSGNESDLALYYRFDLGFPKNVYNLAASTRGYYAGASAQNISFTNATAQPSQLVYGAYTDAGGNYIIDAINYGKDANGVTYTTTPSKPNHEFSPANQDVNLQVSSNVDQYQKLDIDFTDISELPISGKVQYKEGNEFYPVPQGQKLTLDGVTIEGEDAGTDAFGVFSLSAALGMHEFKVHNPEQNRDFGAKSLSFDGQSAYAQSEAVFISGTQATLSGWLRIGSSTALEQSILSANNTELILKNNNKLAVKVAGVEKLTSTVTLLNETWVFIALTANSSAQTLGLYVDNTLDQATGVSGIQLAGQFNLGASMRTGTPANFFEGHLDQIEYRNTVYAESNLQAIKSGASITNDNTYLKAVYAFNENLGTKAISLAANAENKTLLLQGATRDASVFHTYVRKFKYDYTASNGIYNPSGDTYNLNVIKPITSMDFENNTRYGIVGQIVIPCNYSVGTWTGKVVRTDLSGDPYEKAIANFNTDNTVFAVDNLMPGSYRIELQHDSSPAFLQSPVLEVKDGWVAHEFEYRNPLQVEVNIIGRDSISTDSNQYVLHMLPLQYAKACDGNYVLDQGESYRMEIRVFEDYNGQRCYQSDVQYDINGDLGAAIPKTAGGSTSQFTINSNGIDTIGFVPNVPNFSGTLDRKFEVTASRGQENPQSTIKAYILGSKQFETDFTLDAPEEIVTVLHDPSGDKSSLTWKKDNSVMFSKEFSEDGGVNVGLDLSTGTDVEHYIGNWAGIGGGVLFATKIIDSESNALFKFNQVLAGGGKQSFSYVVSSNQSVSTSSDPKAAGIQSDVYVGYSSVIRMGRGKTLYMDGCTAKVQDNTEVMKTEEQPVFHFTHYEIENSLIPSLRELRDIATDSVEILEYQDRINNWNQILQDNIERRANIDSHKKFSVSNQAGSESVPSTVVFSGGVGNINYTLTETDNDSYESHVSTSTAFEKGFSNSFLVFGVKLKIKTTVKANFDFKYSSTTGGGNSESYSINLDDDDIGDQFELMIKKDPSYGSPIFKTISGRSRCPYEEFTVPREGVDISVDRYFVDTLIGSPAIFNVTLTNTQVFNDSVGKSYMLAVSQTSNDSGAVIKLNGNPFTAPVSYFLAPGASTNATITVERGPSGALNYNDIGLYFYSGCEGSQGTIKYSNLVLPEGVLMRDVETISAQFLSPCAESVELDKPTDLWVVNSTMDNKLNFRFKVNPSISAVDKIRLEYLKGQNNNELILEEIDTDSLIGKADVSGFYSWTADVESLADGAYQFRVTPVCGVGQEAWRTSNPSPWVTGNIFRENPVITQVYPTENGIWDQGNIAITYNRSILSDNLNPNNITLKGVLAGVEYDMFAAELINTGDYIQIPDHAKLDLDSAYTVEFWVKPSTYPSQESPIIKKGDNISISLTADGYLNNGRLLSTQKLVPNKWTHVAVVFDGNSTMKTYFDGQEVSFTQFAADFFVNNDPLEIAKDANGARFKGSLDEIRIWNTNRSNLQLFTYMQSMLLGNEDNLVAYFPLDNNALEGEGVRDFTGNAAGTTAAGITWSSNAAPMKAESVVQEVPIQIIHADNQVFVKTHDNFPETYLEGSLLTLAIADDKVKDEFGNPAKGKSWQFLFNKNAVAWSQSNWIGEIEEGQSTSFDVSLANAGATATTYKIVDLPSWMTISSSSVSNPTEINSLPSSFQHDFTVQVADWLLPGEHTAYLTAETPTGKEHILVTVTVNCAKPNFTVATGLPYSMNITAELTIDGQVSSDAKDEVIAFVGTEARGKGSIQETAGKYRAQFQIGGRLASGEQLTFKIWDASACVVREAIETYTFNNGGLLGTINNPASVTASDQIQQSISIDPGFQLISFQVADQALGTDLALSSVNGFTASDYLNREDAKTVIWNGSTWSGDFTSLDVRQSYDAHAQQATTITLSGIPVNESTQIPLDSGINFLGYFLNRSMTVDEALQSLTISTAQSGDYISSKEDGFAEYVEGTGWVGALQNLRPGRGYRLYVQQAGTLQYVANQQVRMATPTNAPKGELVDLDGEALNKGLKVNSLDFPYYASLIGEIVLDDNSYYDMPLLLTAYVNGDYRGSAIPYEKDGEITYFMNIYLKNQQEQVNFKALHPVSGKEVSLNQQLTLQAQQMLGNMRQPYAFTIPSTSNDLMDDDGLALQNFPNPFNKTTNFRFNIPETGFVELAVYDLMGRKIATLVEEKLEAGSHEVVWDIDKAQINIPTGTYIYRLMVGDRQISKKLLVE